jgi:hypothetical protein
MASWTDAITQFNPYVSTLPVEAMVKVGMEKQRRYDEGYAKIQAQIDQVAGLDVIRDVDKNYLQSKLNELGGKLQTFAASDFSNYQLVNSVAGMAKQVAADETVQGAVSSTAWYRKQMKDMEAAIKEGKSSVQNQWDFNEKANKYLTSTDLKQKFTDRYTQYIDVDKKMMDVLKQLHPNLTEQDIPYERNADGSLNYNKIAASMSRITKETISANQIENAVRASLTPDDMNQLSINGRYTFRSIQTPEQLQEYSRTRYKSQIENIDDKISKLEGYKNLVTSDAGEYNKTVSIIESLKNQRGQLQTSLNEELEMIAANPDDAKFQIYKNGAISQFANAFSWETNKVQQLTNPVLEAQHWEKNYALDQSKFALDIRKQNWTEYKDKFDMDMAEKNYNLAVKKATTDLYGTQSGAAIYGGQSTLVKDPLAAMNDDINSNLQTANTKFNEILKGVPNVDAATLEKNLKDYANGDKSALNKIPIEWRDEADAILRSRAEAKRLQISLDRIDQEILNTPEMKEKRKQLDVELSSRPSLRLGNETFSQKEIFDFLNKEKFRTPQGSTGGAGAGQLSVDFSKLSKKEKVLYNALSSSRYATINPYSTRKQTEQEKLVNAVIDRYAPVVSGYRSFNQEVSVKKNQKLLEVTGKYVPVVYNINVSNKEGATSRDTWEGIAGSALMMYGETLGGIKGGAQELSQKQVETGRNWLTAKGGKEDIQYKKLVQGDKTFLVMAKGNEEITIPLTQEVVDQLPVNENEPSNFNKKIKSAQQLGGGDTNPKRIPSVAILQRWDFPNVKGLNVTADVKANKTNPGKNYIVLNIKTPSGWRYMQLNDYPMSVDNVERFSQTMTDNDIKTYFLNDPTVSASLKEEIRNL